MNKKAVILLSGGLDSTVTLYMAKARGYKLTGISFDYGQRHKKELDCARKIAKLNKIRLYTVKTALPWAKSSLTDLKIKVARNRRLAAKNIPLTYVSGRNIIFLSYAFSLAESIGAKSVFIGAHTQDYSGYPDCRPQFLFNFNEAVNLGLKNNGIKIAAPLIDMGKSQIIEIGIKLGVPFHYTWSCYKGGSKPCGVCDSCRFRAIAFCRLGLNDPILSSAL